MYEVVEDFTVMHRILLYSITKAYSKVGRHCMSQERAWSFTSYTPLAVSPIFAR